MPTYLCPIPSLDRHVPTYPELELELELEPEPGSYPDSALPSARLSSDPAFKRQARSRDPGTEKRVVAVLSECRSCGRLYTPVLQRTFSFIRLGHRAFPSSRDD